MNAEIIPHGDSPLLWRLGKKVSPIPSRENGVREKTFGKAVGKLFRFSLDLTRGDTAGIESYPLSSLSFFVFSWRA